MNKSLSVHLDLIRGLAAVLVVYHHYSNHIVEPRRAVFPNVGQESVMVFFVLSGFVIAYVISEREKTFTEFLTRRFARLWSVLLPSLAIILGANLLSTALDPSVHGAGPKEWIAKLFLAGTFLNLNTLVGGAPPPGGGVLWSLTCEFWYYLLCGVWVFAPNTKMRWALLLPLCIFLGPRVLLLMPVWIMGFLLYKRRDKIRMTKAAAWVSMAAAGLAVTLLIASGVRYQHTEIPGALGQYLGHASESPYFLLVGFCMAVYLAGALALSRHGGAIPASLVPAIRFLASVSFFLYLTHLPLMTLMASILKRQQWHEPVMYFIPTLTIGIALLVGRPIEDSKRAYVKPVRNALERIQSFLARPERVGSSAQVASQRET